MMILIKNWSSYLFDFRFEVLAIILVWIVFGGNLFSGSIFYDILFPISVLALIAVSFVMVKNERNSVRYALIAFAMLMSFVLLGRNALELHDSITTISLIIPLCFFMLLSMEVFRQMIQEKTVTNDIVAAFDCYLLLGILGAILFSIILQFNPDAYTNVDGNSKVFDKMLYFSFITLTSIGYGDIAPISPLAEKITAFFGLIGHFYSVVVVGIIVGKYLAK
jgi:hypothetical protein